MTFVRSTQTSWPYEFTAGVLLWTGPDGMIVQHGAEQRLIICCPICLSDETVGWKVVKSGFVVFCGRVSIAGMQGRRCWKKVAVPGQAVPLCESHHAQDGAVILQADAIKLSRVLNTSTSFVREETTFVVVMRTLVNYARVFLFQYKVSFVDGGIKDIVEDTMSSGFLPTKSGATWVLCVWFAKHL